MRTRALGVLAMSLVAGCVHVDFASTDANFHAHELPAAPEAFVDRLPTRPYHSVGIIEVWGNVSTLGDAMTAAKDKAREIGCDLVVDRAIHPVGVGAGASDLRSVVVVAQGPPANMMPMGNNAAGPGNHYQFICGVYDAP